MSHNDELTKVRLRLWVAAGGRCQYPGCNKLLYRDDLTLAKMNASNVAHIVAETPGGPRGDKVLSGKLKANFSNLMLMCYDHHHLIDHAGLSEHTVDVLWGMKAEHERRIEAVTEIDREYQTDILTYTANIGEFTPRILAHETAIGVRSMSMYPASPLPIELGRGTTLVTDAEKRFWRDEEEHLRGMIQRQILPQFERGQLHNLSVFAWAPQPLLTLLGHLLCDINSTHVYQRHHEPATWAWQDHPDGFQYVVEEPDGVGGQPALVLALSAAVKDHRIFETVGDDAAIWRVTIPKPDRDFLKSSQQLQQFRELVRHLLDKIKDCYDRGTVLNVFPAAPVSIAVELGRAIQPKAHMPLRLWDENRGLGGFVPALNISLAQGDE